MAGCGAPDRISVCVSFRERRIGLSDVVRCANAHTKREEKSNYYQGMTANQNAHKFGRDIPAKSIVTPTHFANWNLHFDVAARRQTAAN